MTQIVVNDVEFLWPKIDQPYRFDQMEKRSVPCDPLADGATYEINFKCFPPTKADELLAAMREAWAEFVKQNPGAQVTNQPYKKDEDGGLIFKAKLKAAYGGDKTRPPAVYDKNNQKITDPDFQLTTGSIGDVAVTLVPYATGMASGVSLRLRAVLVKELSEMAGGASPFGPPKTEFNQPMTDEKKAAQTAFQAPSAEDNMAAAKKDTSDPFNDDIPF